MAFFPHDTTKYRPAKLIIRADLLREADRAIQEGLGGYENRHELVNDAIEQLLVDLRYDAADQLAVPVKSNASPTPDRPPAPAVTIGRIEPNGRNGGTGEATPSESPIAGLDDVEPITEISASAIKAPATRGLAIENEVADIRDVPQLGLHNRDAPSIFALAVLAERAKDGPVPMRPFYEDATAEAWRLAAALGPWEHDHGQKVTIMLPRNRAKPQTAGEGYEFFGIGQVNRRPDDQGRLAAFGPFYLWRAAALVRRDGEVMIGMTGVGWDLLEAVDGLDFGFPHNEAIARNFLAHLNVHAAADLWGFRELLGGIRGGAGRNDLRERFRVRLTADFPTERSYTESVAESTAQGYLSRARAWGMVAAKLTDRRYGLTEFGESILDEMSHGRLVAATSTATV